MSRWRLLAVVLAAGVMGGCIKEPATVGETNASAMVAADAKPEDGIAVPAAVRDTLGITFAKVEMRAVAETRRVPGQFELLPTARQEYRALLAGRIDLRVEQFQQVNAGDVLFTIDSPQWREIQHEAVEAEGDMTMAQAALDVARAHMQETQSALGRQEQRLKNLSSVKVRNAGLESEASTLRASLPRLQAETRVQEAALREAGEHYASRLNTLSSVTGIPIEELRAKDGDGAAAWRTIAVLPVRAQSAGVVEDLAVNRGGWLEEGALALSVVNPTMLRFHAETPQADIGLFHDGQQANIVPPQGGTVDIASTLPGKLVLGLTADARDRTLSLYVTPDEVAPWAKAGVGGYLEVTLSAEAPKQTAIPLAAVTQDGLEQVIFRRNPKDPDRVRRMVADLGPSDGRWVVLRSGVKEGDEVVLEGVYALKLSGSSKQAPPGYHYHADGALHKNH